MKNLIWIVVAAIIAGGAYFLFTGQSPQQAVTDVTETAKEAAEEAVTTAAETDEATRKVAPCKTHITPHNGLSADHNVRRATLSGEFRRQDHGDADHVPDRHTDGHTG